jgi:transcriptional regulator with XRE-family HTH domain
MTMATGVELFGHLLRALRKAEGLSIDQLAERAGLTGSGLRFLENGNRSPSFSTAAQLADAIGVPLDYLRGGMVGRADGSARLQLARAEALADWDRRQLTSSQLAEAAAEFQQVLREARARAERWEVRRVIAGGVGFLCGTWPSRAEAEADIERRRTNGDKGKLEVWPVQFVAERDTFATAPTPARTEAEAEPSPLASFDPHASEHLAEMDRVIDAALAEPDDGQAEAGQAEAGQAEGRSASNSDAEAEPSAPGLAPIGDSSPAPKGRKRAKVAKGSSHGKKRIAGRPGKARSAAKPTGRPGENGQAPKGTPKGTPKGKPTARPRKPRLQKDADSVH